MTAHHLRATALLLDAFDGGEVVSGPMGMYALELADHGFDVLPLHGKIPTCPHGVLDATRNRETIVGWWTQRPDGNVGVRVPAGLFVLDVDTRHQGDVMLARLEREHGRLPATLTTITGSDGLHVWFTHPGFKPSTSSIDVLGESGGIGWRTKTGAWRCGIEIKTHAGYLVAPPSIHPDTGRSYRWQDPAMPVSACPAWLLELLRRPVPVTAARSDRTSVAIGVTDGDGPADRFTASRSWHDVLVGWSLKSGDGDEDGSRWRHPSAS